MSPPSFPFSIVQRRDFEVVYRDEVGRQENGGGVDRGPIGEAPLQGEVGRAIARW